MKKLDTIYVKWTTLLYLQFGFIMLSSIFKDESRDWYGGLTMAILLTLILAPLIGMYVPFTKEKKNVQ